MQRLSAHFLVSALVLTACPGDSGNTTTGDPATTSGGNTTTNDPSAGTDEPTTVTPTTDPTATTSPSTTDPTATTDPTGASTTDPTGASTTDPTGASTTDPTGASTTDGTTTGGGGVCGDGAIEGDEACDDSNVETELSKSAKPPLMYDASACIDDCSLVLALCGNGKLDPGEACDDGNPDSYDACTTSCTVNDKSFHAPCKRMCNQQCDTDVTSGTFTGCENMEVPANGKAVCYVSTKFQLAPRYFAEGECAVTAQKCSGLACPPKIGDYDLFKDCPAGTTLVDRETKALGVTVNTKVCQKVCESDADCRWNAYDTIWAKPGEFRCQVTADSKGVKICADAQN